MDQNKSGNIQLKDITLAATLVYFGFPIRELIENSIKDHHTGQKKPYTFFVFKETSELQSIISDFESGRVVVEPRKFSSSLRECKDRMYDHKNRRVE